MVRARNRGGSIPRASGRRRRKKEIRCGGARGRSVLLGYARCLESEEGKARRAVPRVSRKSHRKWNDCGLTPPHRFWRECAGASRRNFAGNRGLLSAAVEKLRGLRCSSVIRRI